MNLPIKKWHLLFVLSFFALIANFFRPFLFGYDSYASWACMAMGWCETIDYQEGFLLFLQFMPPVKILVVLVMVLSLFVSLFACWKICQLYFEERLSWISVFFVLGFCPIIIFEFSKFENELFAVPLIFWGLYFLLKKDYWVGLVFWVASFWFWLWPAHLVFGWFWNLFMKTYPLVLEGQLFSGLLPLFGGIFFLPLVFLVKDKKLWLFFIVFLVGGLGSGKIAILLVPFVVLGIAKMLQVLEEKKYNYNFLWVLAIILFVGLQYSVFVSPPTVYDMGIVRQSIDLSEKEDLELKSDWSFGYWLWYFGYKAKNHPGNLWVEDFNGSNFIALTDQNLATLGCEWQGGQASYVRSINIWKCTT